MSDLGLGKLITTPQQRDAIHIAVAPVVATVELLPGDDIGFVNNDGESVGTCDNLIGIVDPFLGSKVRPGQRFWMWLTPNTITSLRHEWTHPAFNASPSSEPVAEQQLKSPVPGNWRTDAVLAMCKGMLASGDYSDLPILADALEESGYPNRNVLEQCRHKRLSSVLCLRLVRLVESEETAAAVHWLDEFAEELDQTYNQLMTAADSWIESGDYTYDNSERYKRVDRTLWPIFWENYEKVTGTKVDNHEDTFYTCSC